MRPHWTRRFQIDEGRHLLDLVPDEDASFLAGEARYRASCSCNRLSSTPGSAATARAAYERHAARMLGPHHVGARVTVLLIAMLAVWAACFAGGALLISRSGLVLGVANLTGLALAFALMVLCRRTIAPTRG